MLAETAEVAVPMGSAFGAAILAILGDRTYAHWRDKKNGNHRCNGGPNRLCTRHAERLTAVETRLEGLQKNVDDGFQRVEKGIDNLWQELKRRNGSG